MVSSPCSNAQIARRVLGSLPLTAALFALPAAGARVAGIEIPERLETGGTSLVLNGAGVRTRYLLDVYVGGLYLTRRSSDAAAILAADEPMAIKIWIVTNLITGDQLRKSIEEGFQRSTRGNTAVIREEIDALIGVFDDEIDKGDRFELVYLPGRGLKVFANDAHRATIECGSSFRGALFGIWISDRPVQSNLKRRMLGR